MPGHLLKEIEHFFEVFKDPEGSEFGVLEWGELRRPKRLLEGAIRAGRRVTKSPPQLQTAVAAKGMPRKRGRMSPVSIAAFYVRWQSPPANRARNLNLGHNHS